MEGDEFDDEDDEEDDLSDDQDEEDDSDDDVSSGISSIRLQTNQLQDESGKPKQEAAECKQS